MPHRLAPALALVGVLGVASCSLIDGGSDPGSSSSSSSSPTSASPASSARPPQAPVADLVLPEDDISSGEDWRAEQGQELEVLVADHPPSSEGGAVEPARCAEAALVTKGPDGADTDFAGAVGTSSDDTGAPVLVVVTDGRSAADLRTARERCAKFTAKAPDRELTMTEEVSEGPDIPGADESFALNSTYELDGHRGNALTRYGIVAEVRQTLVVVMVNPEDTDHGDDATTTTVSDAAKGEAVTLVTQQVDRIAAAN